MADAGERYDLSDVRRRVPSDHAEFFVGFSPSKEDVVGFDRSALEPSPDAARGIRSVWDRSGDPRQRFVIDVVECADADAALDALAERLEWNQLKSLPTDMNGPGLVSFRHPPRTPPATFFVRANLCVSVISFGSVPIEVSDVAARIDRRLAVRPQAPDHPETLHLALRPRDAERQEPFIVDVAPPVRLVEGSYIAVLVEGGIGVLDADHQAVWVRPVRPGELRIERITTEPGRPPVHAVAIMKIVTK
jgi:hypothetical protein